MSKSLDSITGDMDFITGGEYGYSDYIEQITKKHSLPLVMLKAFVVGGLFCVFGQFIMKVATNLGINEEKAGTWCSIILIFIAVILTGLGAYAKMAKFAGAGTLVPITGFANSVAAPAIEYKKEGQVFGIGAKIFTIAGPVVLYGIMFSWVLGLIYYIFMIMRS